MTTPDLDKNPPLALYLQTRNFHDFYIIADLDDASGYRRQDPLWENGDIIDRYPIDKEEHCYTYQQLKVLVLENLAYPDPASRPPLIVAEFAVLPGYAKPRIGIEIPDFKVYFWTRDFWAWARKARTRLICNHIEALSTAVVTYRESNAYQVEREAYSEVLDSLLKARHRCGSACRLWLSKYL